MKTCKSCKYFAPTLLERMLGVYQFVQCRHPKNADPVTGNAGLYCKLAREFQGNCEKDGKLWEATK